MTSIGTHNTQLHNDACRHFNAHAKAAHCTIATSSFPRSYHLPSGTGLCTYRRQTVAWMPGHPGERQVALTCDETDRSRTSYEVKYRHDAGAEPMNATPKPRYKPSSPSDRAVLARASKTFLNGLPPLADTSFPSCTCSARVVSAVPAPLSRA